VLGTDLGTGRAEIAANNRDMVTRTGTAETGLIGTYETDRGGGGRGGFAHSPVVADPMCSLPAEARPEGFAPGGCHAAREYGSTCQLSALPDGAAARTTVCVFGSLSPRTAHPGFARTDFQRHCHVNAMSQRHKQFGRE